MRSLKKSFHSYLGTLPLYMTGTSWGFKVPCRKRLNSSVWVGLLHYSNQIKEHKRTLSEANSGTWISPQTPSSGVASTVTQFFSCELLDQQTYYYLSLSLSPHLSLSLCLTHTHARVHAHTHTHTCSLSLPLPSRGKLRPNNSAVRLHVYK